MEETTLSISVDAHHAGQRVDLLLKRLYPEFSRTYFQSLIERGAVHVNGHPLKKKDILKPGDELEVTFLCTETLDLIPEAIDLDILYEDEELLVINKPPGMVVHPAPGHYRGTFVHALLYHCQHLSGQFEGSPRPGIVHRLDKNTSGILIGAKTLRAHQKLVEMLSQRAIEKTYWAITRGCPTVEKIETLIGRHPQRRQEMAVVPEKGKMAITWCQPITSKGPYSLVQLQLITGRTHQIRVHLRHIRCPIVGDPLYGVPSPLDKSLSRQMLHACSVRFDHPFTQQPLEIKAPLPRDFREHLQLLLHLHEIPQTCEPPSTRVNDLTPISAPALR